MPIELTGMDDLLARLQGIGSNVEQVKEKALKKGAEVMRAEMAANAPVLTGKLKESIEVSNIKTQNGSMYVDVGPKKEVFYAKFAEFGTVKQRKKPFIEPAFLSKRKETLDIIKETIREAIEDV